jgi:hypothetical protein
MRAIASLSMRERKEKEEERCTYQKSALLHHEQRLHVVDVALLSFVYACIYEFWWPGYTAKVYM